MGNTIDHDIASRDRSIFAFLGVYILIYAGNAVVGSFMPVYLNEIGLDNYQIGLVFSIGSLAGIFSQPIWGLAADRSRYKNTILKIIVGACAVISLFFLLKKDFVYITIVFAFFMLFYASIFSTSDAITLEGMLHKRIRYGHIRLGGTFGYAAIVVVAGFLVKIDSRTIFPLYSLIAVLLFSLVFTIPKVKGHQSGHQSAPLPFRQLFKNKELVLMIIYHFIIQSTLGFYYSFYPIYFSQIGGQSSLLGLSLMISALSEIPFLLFADKIIRKIGARTMLMVSGLAAALRWGMFSVMDNVYGIMAVQLLHGIIFAAMTVSMAIYINEHVDRRLKASGQTLNTISGIWLSRIAGSAIGGAVSRVLDLRQIFAYASLICIIAVVLFYFFRKRFY